MQKVFFNGQVYDAFSLFANLAGSAVTSLILIDNYVDIAAFNNQYPKLEVKITSAFHDRFLILDREKVIM